MNKPGDPSKVELALQGLVCPMDLSTEEQEEYLDRMGASHWEPSPVEDAFFAELRRLGQGVGMDEAGNIIHQAPEATPAARPLDDWTRTIMENMSRMASDEDYRKLIARKLS